MEVEGSANAHICETFLCPSHNWLSEAEAALIAHACSDWYLYGLVVTDVPFARACLAAVAAESGTEIQARHVENEKFRASLRHLFALKELLEPGSEGLFGAFGQDAQGEPVPRQIDYVSIGRKRSAHDEILRCIGADPRSGNDLDALEEIVRTRLEACARAHEPLVGAAGGSW